MKRILAGFLSFLIATNVFWTSLGCGGGASVTANLTPEPGAGPQKGVVVYVNDHLGNAHLITDSKGNVLREESRHPYGLDWRVDGADATTADYVYTGKEYDEETGLVYFGGRYYSPEMGRWITPDPAFFENPALAVKRPLENNLYSYVASNPVNLVDPYGEFAFAPLIGIGLMAAAYVLTDENVANAPGPNDQLVSNPTFGERAERYAMDAITGYLGLRILSYAFVGGTTSLAEKAIIKYEADLGGAFGRYTATWKRNPKAIVRFEPMIDESGGYGIRVTDLNRGTFPSGSGGKMLADIYKETDLIYKPEFIEFSNIIEEKTVSQLSHGIGVENTRLADTMRNATKAFGGEVSSMELNTYNLGKYDMTGNIKYRFAE